MPRINRTTLLLLLATLFTLSLTLPTPSLASGTYIHRSCLTSTDISDGPTGWQPFSYSIPGASTLARCDDDGTLYTEITTPASLPPGQGSGWTYQAPPGTTISRIAGSISGWTSPWASGRRGLVQLVDQTGVRTQHTGSIDPQHPQAFDLGSLSDLWVTFRVICDPFGAACTNDVALGSLFQPALTLVDRDAPVANSPSGSFTTDTTLVGQERLNFTASDAGGGVARVRLYVDGQHSWIDHVIDEDDGRCVESEDVDGTWVYSSPRPCPSTVSANELIDTTKIPDGRHTLTVKVVDAAQQETTIWSEERLIANRPPRNGQLPPYRDNSVLTTVVVGTAIEAINDGAWTGPNLTVRREWARCQADGSEPCVTISGATGLAYTPSTADVGHSLRLLVTATNVAGSLTVASRPTGVVAARSGGATTPDPSSDPDPDEEPTPDPDPDPDEDPAPGPVPNSGVPAPVGGGNVVVNPAPNPIKAPLPVAGVPVVAGHVLSGHVVGEASGVGCPQERATLRLERVSGGVVKLGYGRNGEVRAQVMCTNNGKVIEGARLEVVTRVGTRPAVTSAVVTDGSGHALLRLAKGPGRTVTVGYRMYADDPFARATATVKVAVNGRIRLRGSHRRLRNGKALRMRGQLLGGYVPRRGVTLNVQWRDRGRWRPFAQIKSDKKGMFSYAYRFTRTNRAVTYTLRVQASKGQLDYPFQPVASNAVKVTVMP